MERVGFVRALWILIRMGLPDRRSSLVIVAGFAVLGGGMFVLQSACYPWAHSVTFGPTLTGRWLGELTAPVRGKHAVFVTLWDDPGDSGGPDFAGAARLCDTRGDVREFGVTGNTRNWRGTSFSFTTFISEHRDGEGVQLETVDGAWDRADRVSVRCRLRLFRIRGGGTFSSSARSAEQIALEDTDVTFTLARGSEQNFRAACDRVRGEAQALRLQVR